MRSFVRPARLLVSALPFVAVATVGLGSHAARAYPTGPPAGYDGENNSCVACHFGGGTAPTPTITVTGLDGPFNAGDVAHLTLTVVGAQAAAGFEAGTDGGGSGGTFDPAGTTGIKTISSNKIIEHSQPQSYDANLTATWTFDLTVAGGSHTLFVAANDVNLNNSSAGDHVGTASFDFTATGGAGEGEGSAAGEGEGSAAGEGEGSAAGEGEGAAGGEGEGEGATNAPGGCSATSTSAGIPALGFVAIAFGLSRLRRRR